MDYKVSPAEWPGYAKPRRQRGRTVDVSNPLTNFMQSDVPCIRVDYKDSEMALLGYKSMFNYARYHDLDCKIIIRKNTVFIKKGRD